MGSVIDYMTCPRCNVEQALYTDYDYNSGEESALCMECGYARDHSIKRDADGKAIFTIVNGMKVYEWEDFEIPEPYGVLHIGTSDGFGAIDILKDEDEYKAYKSNATKHSNIVKATVSRLLDGVIVKEVIVDNTNSFLPLT